jgi:hypothetical protein
MESPENLFDLDWILLRERKSREEAETSLFEMESEGTVSLEELLPMNGDQTRTGWTEILLSDLR